ncbi:MAG: hypothetical protein QW303_01230 [Nitrososphaerota archaeon]
MNSFTKDDIFKILDNLSDTEETVDDIENFFSSEKISSFFLLKLLERIGLSLGLLIEDKGVDFTLRLLSYVIDPESSDDEIKNFLIKQLRSSDLSSAYLSSNGVADLAVFDSEFPSMWDRLLLILGINPVYSDELKKVFGENGANSIGLLLKSVIDGKLAFESVLNAIKNFK